MKVRKMLRLLKLIERLPRNYDEDVQEVDLGTYYSESQDEYLEIMDMDFIYVLNAIKMHGIGTASNNGVLIEQINKWSEEAQRWRKAYANDCYTQGWRYVFSEIPNDTDGQEFVDTMKKYLNKESYKMRVKGQHLKKELYGQGKAYHGANLGDSSHMRIYIDVKKGDE